MPQIPSPNGAKAGYVEGTMKLAIYFCSYLLIFFMAGFIANLIDVFFQEHPVFAKWLSVVVGLLILIGMSIFIHHNF